jgi:hypothetical protein
MNFGIPGIPGGGGDAGKGADDIDAAIKQVDELNGKLDESEKLIYNMLNKAAPTVNIPMPKLNPSMFGGSGYVAVPPGDSQPNPAAKAGTSKAKKKAEALRQKTEAAKKKAEAAQQEMAEEAKKAMDQAGGAAKQIVGQTFSAATSIAVAIGCSYAPLSPFMGQVLAGVAAAVTNFLGLAMSWKSRSNSIFQVMNKVFDKMIKKVTDVLDTVDDMIMGPLEKLENAIEDMAEEQKPTLDKMKKFESAMKMADPSFDLPDPGDLQKPLDGCDDMIDDFVDKAKKEIPDKLEEMIQSTTAGKIATDEGQFNMYVVYLPLLMVLLLNVGLAVAQVAIMFKAPDSDSVHDTDVVEKTDARRLRGSPLPKGIKLPKGMDVDSLMPYIQPALVQVALAGLQIVGALIMSSGPRICSLVNGAITSFGKKVNDRVNLRIKTAVDKVFGEAFKMVKEKSDQFFPKFKDATTKLKSAMQTAAKAGAAVAAVSNAAQSIGSVI